MRVKREWARVTVILRQRMDDRGVMRYLTGAAPDRTTNKRGTT
jgi:hypothetical protein